MADATCLRRIDMPRLASPGAARLIPELRNLTSGLPRHFRNREVCGREAASMNNPPDPGLADRPPGASLMEWLQENGPRELVGEDAAVRASYGLPSITVVGIERSPEERKEADRKEELGERAQSWFRSELENGTIELWGAPNHGNSAIEKIPRMHAKALYFDFSRSSVDLHDSNFSWKNVHVWKRQHPNNAGDALIEQEQPAPAKLRRKPTVDYSASDAPLIEKMHNLVYPPEGSESPALKPWQAARVLADQAEGGGTIESRVSRLFRRFKESLSPLRTT
jgi:hypothetical protein